MTEWAVVLEHLRTIAASLSDERAATSAGRGARNLHRNGHPLDIPLRNIRLNISRVAALMNGDPHRSES